MTHTQSQTNTRKALSVSVVWLLSFTLFRQAKTQSFKKNYENALNFLFGSILQYTVHASVQFDCKKCFFFVSHLSVLYRHFNLIPEKTVLWRKK